MKVLITGGAGFIGSTLAGQLTAKGHEIVVLDNLSAQIHGNLPVKYPESLDKVHFIRGDVSQLEDWLRALEGVECVVHLAAETGTAQSMYQIAHYNKANTQGTALLFEALTRSKGMVRRVILGSSRSVYGEGAYTCSCSSSRNQLVYPHPRSVEDLEAHRWEPRCPCCGETASVAATPEDGKIRPASIYAATKYAQEELVRIGCEALELSAVILRFQNVYGEGQSLNNPYTGILSIFSTRIRRTLSLPIFEDGLESRDFVHVSDVATALELALTAEVPSGSIYNVGAGRPTSVMDLASLLVQKFNGTVPPHVTGEFRVGDIRHCYADTTRIKQDLGFIPKVSMEEGLSRFAAWVSAQALPEDGLERANRELRERKLMR